VNVDHHFRGRPIERLASLLVSLLSKVGRLVIVAIYAFRACAIAATTPRFIVLVPVRNANRR